MQFDEVFWVGVSFVTFIFLVFKPASRFLSAALDKRAAQIEKDLNEATRLREEAQAVLAVYQKKQDEMTREASEIIDRAKAEAERMRKDAEASLKAKIDERVARANDKIAQEEAKALQSIQQQVVDVALATAQTILTDSLKKESDDALIQLALKDVGRVVH